MNCRVKFWRAWASWYKAHGWGSKIGHCLNLAARWEAAQRMGLGVFGIGYFVDAEVEDVQVGPVVQNARGLWWAANPANTCDPTA